MTNYKNEMIQEFPYLEERFINNNSGFDIEQFFTECVLNINKEIRSEKIKDMPKCAKYFLELRFNRSSLNPEYIPWKEQYDEYHEHLKWQMENESLKIKERNKLNELKNKANKNPTSAEKIKLGINI